MRSTLSHAFLDLPSEQAPREHKLVEVTHKSMLCKIRFFNENEWSALPISKRPVDCVHKPGTGWVCLQPVAGLN